MQRVFYKLLAFCFVLALSLGLVQPVHGQKTGVQITAFNKDGSPITSLIDGNQISLKIELPDPAMTDTQVDFRLAGVDTPVANCQITIGERSCQSAPFPALGW